jgi:hypothetical protein
MQNFVRQMNSKLAPLVWPKFGLKQPSGTQRVDINQFGGVQPAEINHPLQFNEREGNVFAADA